MTISRRLGHGLAILAITLAVVGAIASSTDWEPTEAGALGAGQTAVEAAASTGGGSTADTAAVPAATFDVPIRSGRLSDDVTPTRLSPVAVRVAGIALEAPVIPVGVDEQNQFAVPAADTVGWYRFSASPGDPGASVLAAHVDYGGRPGAFFNLEDVLPGDTLEVELEDGSVLLYEVTGNTIYDKTDLPAGELFRKDGSSVLQLITCGGTFNPTARSYEANVVVTAVPVGA